MSEVSTEPVIHHSHVFVEWLVGSHEIACDLSEYDWCHKGEAKWALFMVCPHCVTSRVYLADDGCKELLMHTEDVLGCRVCDEYEIARKFINRIEAL